MKDNELSQHQGGLLSKVLRFMQWAIFLLVLLLGRSNIIHFEHRGLPGFPEALFWALLGLSAVLAVSHLPAIFFRHARKWQVAAYVGIIPLLILMGTVGSESRRAFYETPEGKIAEAKQDAAAALSAKDEAERAETRRTLADAEKTRADLEAYEQELEGCFSSWGHRLDSLEEEVKGSLHNPNDRRERAHCSELDIWPQRAKRLRTRRAHATLGRRNGSSAFTRGTSGISGKGKTRASRTPFTGSGRNHTRLPRHRIGRATCRLDHDRFSHRDVETTYRACRRGNGATRVPSGSRMRAVLHR